MNMPLFSKQNNKYSMIPDDQKRTLPHADKERGKNLKPSNKQ